MRFHTFEIIPAHFLVVFEGLMNPWIIFQVVHGVVRRDRRAGFLPQYSRANFIDVKPVSVL